MLEASSTCQSTLTTKIEEVKVDISLIRQDLKKAVGRVTEAEHRLSHVEGGIPPLQVSTERLEHQLNSPLQKQDDVENQLQRCHLWFVGLPEGTEGSDSPSFLETLLINRESFSTVFVVERAHCLASRQPSSRAPPRIFIAKLLNYEDCNTILRLTRVKGNIPFRNVHIAA